MKQQSGTTLPWPVTIPSCKQHTRKAQQQWITIISKRSRFQGRRRGNRNRSSSHSGSREHKTLTSKCKQCGFTKHTTSGGSCPAIKVTCGFCKNMGHYESVCIKKKAQQNKESRGSKSSKNNGRYDNCSPTQHNGQYDSHSPTQHSATPGPNKHRASANAITVKTTEQLKTDFPRIIFDNVSTITVDQQTPQNTNFITQMETARDGKTYVLTDLDVQLPNKSQCDQIHAKLDMGAETNILPLRTYKKI